MNHDQPVLVFLVFKEGDDLKEGFVTVAALVVLEEEGMIRNRQGKPYRSCI